MGLIYCLQYLHTEWIWNINNLSQSKRREKNMMAEKKTYIFIIVGSQIDSSKIIMRGFFEVCH